MGASSGVNLRKIFAAKAAAAVLVCSLMPAVPAFAGNVPTAQPQTSAQTQNTVKAQALHHTALVKSWSVATDPLLPLGVIGGLGGAYALFCLYAARKKMRGAWLRAGAGGVMALALLNPEIVQENRQPLPTDVIVVVDQSASQGLDHRTEQTEQARAALVKELSGLGNVNVHIIDAGAAKSGKAQDGTELFTALEDGLNNIPRDRIGAVFFLTDGQVQDVPAKPGSIIKGAPVHALISGHATDKDRRIVIDDAPHFGLMKQEQKIRFHVEDDGVKNSTAPVRVVISEEGKVIATEYAVPGEVIETKVDIPHTGTNTIELKVDPLAGELTDINNRAVAQIKGIRENLNVLVISGTPGAGMRMWRRMFKSDADSNLVNFTVLRTPDKLQYNIPPDEYALVPLPVDEIFSTKLGKFDLVVLDHFPYDGMLPDLYFQNIADYVRNGGALLVASGPGYANITSLYNSPLQPILPVRPAGTVSDVPFRPAVSKTGERHPVMRDLSPDQKDPHWGRWLRMIDGQADTGDIVMTGLNGEPLLDLAHEDKGRVAMLMSDDAWLWAKGYDGGGPSANLLQRVAHWLMKDPDMAEEALRLSRENGKIVIEQQTMADQATPVTLHLPDGKTERPALKQVEPGLWRATVVVNEYGLYSAEQAGQHPLKSFISIGPANPKEFQNTISTLGVLQPVMTATGGAVLRMEGPAGTISVPKVILRHAGQDMTKDGFGIRMTEASILKDTNRTTLLPGWLAMLLATGLIAGAFVREGETNILRRKKQPEQNQKGPQP